MEINELKEDFNKHQSETKDTIKGELKMATQNVKEELSKDMENLRKRIKQKSWNKKSL
jgi:aspartate ammonia-lyase